MRIAIIGGSHGTGLELAKQASARGDDVVVASRSGARLDGVVDVVGDAREPGVLDAAIRGADAVVVAVGSAKGSDKNRTDVTRAVVEAMDRAGIRRVVVHSSLGVGDSRANVPAPIRLMLRTHLTDHATQEAAVAGVDWTSVRPGGLTDGPVTGGAAVSLDPARAAARISRADVAAAILACLDDDSTIGKMVYPVLS